MTVTKFCELVLLLLLQYKGSVTSWIRTKNRNIIVGGHKDSYHMCGLAVDVVLEEPLNDTEPFKKRARALGIQVLDEGDHLHLEPRIVQ